MRALAIWQQRGVFVRHYSSGRERGKGGRGGGRTGNARGMGTWGEGTYGTVS
jgi:hypothetical protein